MGNSLYAMPVLVTPIRVREPAKHLETFPFVTGVEHVSTEVEEQGNSNKDSDVASSLPLLTQALMVEQQMKNLYQNLSGNVFRPTKMMET